MSQKLNSFIGSGCSTTSNFKSRGSSQTVIGSTKLPVVKLQCLTAPTPVPSIFASIGYAIPVLKINSVGSSSCGNSTTFFQTVCGSALISIAVIREVKVGSLSFSINAIVGMIPIKISIVVGALFGVLLIIA